MSKRVICLCISISVLLASVIGRVGYISFSGDYLVSDTYNSYALVLETLYPDIYYSDGEKINNNSKKYVAVLKPNERTLADLHNIFPSSEVSTIVNELKKGYPLVIEIDSSKKDNAKYIDIFEVNSSKYVATQLFSPISSGLMKYVKPCGKRKISFYTDAMGRILKGDDGKIYEEYESAYRGIKLTLNKRVEAIACDAAENMKNGCILVMSTADSGILACITKPDTTYINKPFMQYSVGSVFKIIVSACALENNVDYYYTCNGKTTVGDTTYSCQKNHNHGFENLKCALANSCNCYFVNLALELGSEKLIETAEKLGFDDEFALYNEWSVKSARLPSEKDLASKGELALFGFGQGKLTATPVQICYSLCTIANYGNKNQVRLAISKQDETGNELKFQYEDENRVLSEETCKTLLTYLRNVVTDGTGSAAEDVAHKSAGKTATAQTGQYFLGNELLNTWFAGVYPYDNPKYAIVVMTENGKSGSEDCAPIYREIVEKLKYL